MKYILISLLLLSIVKFPVSAQTPTTKESDFINKLKQIEIFKEKIATKVAQVREENKGVASGEIKSVENNALVLATLSGDRKVNFSEDTVIFKMENNVKKEAKAIELQKGTTISALGNYNDSKELLLSKFIFIEEFSIRITGKIADIDSSNFTIKVKAKDGDNLVDIEKNTNSNIYLEGKKLQKAGFSKYKLGDTVFVTAEKNKKEENRFFAIRTIIISAPVLLPTSTPARTPTATRTPTVTKTPTPVKN